MVDEPRLQVHYFVLYARDALIARRLARAWGIELTVLVICSWRLQLTTLGQRMRHCSRHTMTKKNPSLLPISRCR